MFEQTLDQLHDARRLQTYGTDAYHALDRAIFDLEDAQNQITQAHETIRRAAHAVSVGYETFLDNPDVQRLRERPFMEALLWDVETSTRSVWEHLNDVEGVRTWMEGQRVPNDVDFSDNKPAECSTVAQLAKRLQTGLTYHYGSEPAAGTVTPAKRVRKARAKVPTAQPDAVTPAPLDVAVTPVTSEPVDMAVTPAYTAVIVGSGYVTRWNIERHDWEIVPKLRPTALDLIRRPNGILARAVRATYPAARVPVTRSLRVCAGYPAYPF